LAEGLRNISRIQREYAAICAYLALDGSLELHEKAASFFMPAHQNVGELIYMVSAGSVIIYVMTRAYRALSNVDIIQFVIFSLALFILGGASVGFDAVHSFISPFVSYGMDEIFVLIEDGFELIAINIIFAAALMNWSLRLTYERSTLMISDH
jgi:hypothetical protein